MKSKRLDIVINSPPQLSEADVAALRVRSTQPPLTRPTPKANETSPRGHYATMPPDGIDTPRRRENNNNSAVAVQREVSTESGAFSTSLPYSWTDSYLDESPTEMRQRWLTKQTFGPVVQSEGYSTAVSTPYVYRNPEAVWGNRGEQSPMRMESDQDNTHVAKPLSFRSQASTMVATVQVARRQIIPTRQPQHEAGTDKIGFSEMPSPVRPSTSTDGCTSRAPQSVTTSMELPRSESKRNIPKGIARGRQVHAIYEEEDDFF